MNRIRLALIAGGTSSEREVSLAGADGVHAALDKDRYDVRRYDPKTDLARLAADAGEIDAAFILLHGAFGEDGTLQGMLDMLGIPYQGSGVLGSALAMNKLAAKRLYEKAGLPVPAYEVLTSDAPASLDRCLERLGLPLVVKPVSGGSSIGMSIVQRAADLGDAVRAALAHDVTVLVETYVAGLEITAGVLGVPGDDARTDGVEALPLIEIVPDTRFAFFNYEAKYTPGATQEICPARISPELTEKVQSYALRAHRALFLEGYSRSDFILKNDEFHILETNTIPGMTPTSLFPQAAAKAGIGFGPLLDRLIDLGIRARRKRPGGA